MRVGAHVQVGEPGEPGAAALAAAPAPGSLPCLNSHNCTKVVLTTNARKTAFALTANVRRLVEVHGIERLLFNTLTFADHVVDGKEAQRRLHSLATHVLRERYSEWITVMERQKSGRIHYHLLCVTDSDMRTGFNFEEAANKIYSSASVALRSEWSFWRKVAPAYGFGRTEQMPVKSTGEGIAKYVGKYIAKHIEQRVKEDRGLRLVRYSQGAKSVSNQFAWNSPYARLWRAKLKWWARSYSVYEYDGLSERFGSRWAWKYREAIASTVVPDEELSEELCLLQAEELVKVAVGAATALGEDWVSVYRLLKERAA